MRRSAASHRFRLIAWLCAVGVCAGALAVEVVDHHQLMQAIRHGEQDIVLTSRITGLYNELPENKGTSEEAQRYMGFKEVPERCLEPDIFESECANDDLYLRIQAPTTIRGINSTILWDMGFVRRRLLVAADVTLENLLLRGFASDIIPYTFFFMFANNATFICNNCTVESDCGKMDAHFFLNSFNIVGSAKGVQVGEDGMSASVSKYETALAVDTVGSSNSTTTYYDSTFKCNPDLAPSDPLDTTVIPTQTCQNASDKGTLYRGTKAVTKSGYTCQDWEALQPNFHTRLPASYPLAGLVNNYCRNPDNSGEVWCYTVDGPRWEPCGVPFCEENLSGASRGIGSNKASLWWIAVVVVGVCLLLLAGGGFLWFRSHRNRFRHVPNPASELGSKLESTGTTSSASPATSNTVVKLKSLLPTVPEQSTVRADAPADELRAAIAGMDVDERQLVIEELVGRGGFGSVYRGRWRGLQVAIKTVTFQDRTVAGGNAQQRAIAEAAITHSLSHKNVVATYYHEIKPLKCGADGSTIRVRELEAVLDWKLYLVQEFCERGSLRKAIDQRMFLTPQNVTKLSVCVDCLLDICKGMKYIHSKHVIHGDLNPSNVLLRDKTHDGSDATWQPAPARSNAPSESDAARLNDAGCSRTGSSAPRTPREDSSHTSASGVSIPAPTASDALEPWDMVAKICDFGLAVKTEPGQPFVANTRHGTPFYIAPEVRKSGHLSKAADSHAFGVIMWECYHSCPSYKARPNGRLRQRKEFPRFPRDCPLSYAVLAMSCLAEDPNDRPNFWQIHGVLSDLANYIRGVQTCSEQDTAYAHITLSELEEMQASQLQRSASSQTTSESPQRTRSTGQQQQQQRSLVGREQARSRAISAMSEILSRPASQPVVDTGTAACDSALSDGQAALGGSSDFASASTVPMGSAIAQTLRTVVLDVPITAGSVAVSTSLHTVRSSRLAHSALAPDATSVYYDGVGVMPDIDEAYEEAYVDAASDESDLAARPAHAAVIPEHDASKASVVVNMPGEHHGDTQLFSALSDEAHPLVKSSRADASASAPRSGQDC